METWINCSSHRMLLYQGLFLTKCVMYYTSINVFIKCVIRILKSVDNKIIFPEQYCLLVQQLWLCIAEAFRSCSWKFFSKIKTFDQCPHCFSGLLQLLFFFKWLQKFSSVYTIYLSLLACTSVSSHRLLFFCFNRRRDWKNLFIIDQLTARTQLFCCCC